MPSLVHPGVPNNFVGYDSDPEKAKIWVFGVPFDSTTSYRSGARRGPRAIREASQQTEVFDILTKSDISMDPGFFDLGDMDVARGDSAKTVKMVVDEIKNILDSNKTPLMLGGEHTLTAGGVQGVKEFFNKPFKVIYFDAHGDLRDVYEHDKYNHACTARRVVEEVGKENLLEIGIREISEEEFQLFGDRMIFRHECRNDHKSTIEKIKKFVAGSDIYISLDIDVMDVGVVPGTGTPQADGLLYNEILDYFIALKSCKKILAMDLMELAPLRESHVSEVSATKLLFQACAQLKEKF